jgi:hypothetical protein
MKQINGPGGRAMTEKFNPIQDQATCQIKVWCASCQRSDYTASGDKYLCSACGEIMDLQHEVHHEHFPHVTNTEDMA